VIVESPSKVKIIEKILQDHVQQHNLPCDYVVTSCKGHIRNLPTKSDRKKRSGPPKKNKDGDESTLPNTETQSTSFPYEIPGINLANNYKPTYEIIPEKQIIVEELCQLAEHATQVLLATDPDREGEAMAWHLQEVISQSPAVRKNPHVDLDSFYRRVSFTEITHSAVIEALEQKLDVNPALVSAQETRRILDRLAGFTVSPLLWKKIAPGLSAGRVQSVGMALIVQRERERLLFEPTSYASLEVVLHKTENDLVVQRDEISARLYSVNGTTVAMSGDDFTSQGRQLKPQSVHKLHLKIDDARELADALDHEDTQWKVVDVKSTRKQRDPPRPYRTSTLQQDASRLGMSVSDCMSAAQQLYEQGWISYMRTDSSTLSEDAETVVKSTVVKTYGRTEYCPPSSEASGSKAAKKKKEAKFAQEAHEAIRPAIQDETGVLFEPNSHSPRFNSLPDSCQRLYQLIYQRTLTCRMSPLVTNQTTIQIEGTRDATATIFRASGSVVIHRGYTQAYENDVHDESEELRRKVPPVGEGESLGDSEIRAIEHQTKPPARYTEASFVKELETLGVGRPSTYAGIVQILRDRAYVGNPLKSDQTPSGSRKALHGGAISAHRAAGGDEFRGRGGRGGPLVPSLTAFVVSRLLEDHCPSYVDPTFTARMEERLDKIASDETNSDEGRTAYLNEYYAGSDGLAATVKRIEHSVEVDSARRAVLPALETKKGIRDEDKENDVALFVGPWGAYVQSISRAEDKSRSASLPPDLACDVGRITPRALRSVLSTKLGGGLMLGSHPEDGRPIRLLTGRYGTYLKWGEEGDPETTTHSLPREKSSIQAFQIEDIARGVFDASEKDAGGRHSVLTLEEAVGYVSLPRVCGYMNDTTPILAGLGPYGPYLKVNSTYVSLDKKDGDVLSVDEGTSLKLILEAKSKPRSSRRGAKLGEKNGKDVTVKKGRFGPYVTWNKINVGLPQDLAAEPENVTLEEAWALLEPKIACGGPKMKAGRGNKSTEQDASLPPAPKKPRNAYLHFAAEVRPTLLSGGGGKMSIGEVSKALSLLWAGTNEEEQIKYKELADQEKLDYQEKYTKWEASCQEILVQTRKNPGNNPKPKQRRGSEAKKKDTSLPPAPKKPRNAYLHFAAELRPSLVSGGGEKMSIGEVSKELSRLWAGTNEEERAKYRELAAQEKMEYKEKDTEWEASCRAQIEPTIQETRKKFVVKNRQSANPPGISVANSQVVPQLALEAGPLDFSRYGPPQKRKAAPIKAKPPPIKRPRSAYLFFCQAKRPEVSKQFSTLGETTKELARLWSETSDRGEYEALAETDLKRYRAEKEKRMCEVGCDCC